MMLHHLELWVTELDPSIASLGWLLTRMGYRQSARWSDGISYQHGDFYIVLESGPDLQAGAHERRRPGLNHLAFRLESRDLVDAVTAEALSHGFKLMFADKHPHAGGEQHYASYLEDAAGFEVELVAAGP